MRRAAAVLLLALAAAALLAAAVYAYAGLYGLNVVLRRGGTVWATVTPDDARLSPSMRVALQEPPVAIEAGPLAWLEVAPGFEAAELPVLAEGAEVDRLLLARVDPGRFRFEVRTAPAGNRDLDDWMAELKPALVVNGSFFSRYGWPDTPLVSRGERLGPADYDGRHGAFVASGSSARIADLRAEPWPEALTKADNAMVSYPLLLGPEGAGRVKADRRWLANRSFVGQDGEGRIVIGTTAQAFFSLPRLAEFLGRAPIGLTLALNLDGGPPACQAISIGGFRRDFCGSWETKTKDGQIKLLQHVVGSRRWGLPIVLAVFARA